MCRMTALAATVLALAAAPAFAANAPTAAPSAPAVAPAQPIEAQPEAPQKATPQQRAEAERMDPLGRAAFWAREVDTDPRDALAGINLGRALRAMGRFSDAAAAVDHVLVMEPNNQEALLEAARIKVAEGQGFFAIEPAQHAAQLAPRDWRPVTLLAIAYEQAQRDDEALAAHLRAQQLAPDNPAVLANLALYLAAHNRTAEAETLLRRAASLPGSTPLIRQNLALVLGLQGKVDEAERLQRQDLPPELVANNLAYFRAASTPQTVRSWDSMRSPQP